jgi:hypothetical protein
MKSVQEKIGEQYPTVYITFLSVVVGFALEDLIAVVRVEQQFYEFTWLGALMWTKAITVLTFVVVAWLSYSQIAMGRRSAPAPIDALNVLGFTLALFLLNSVISSSMATWYISTTIYIVLGGVSAYYSVDQLKKDGPEFQAYTDSIQTWRGPLLINFMTVPSFTTLAFASMNNMLTVQMHLAILLVGLVFVIAWGAMMYLLWCKHVLNQ